MCDEMEQFANWRWKFWTALRPAVLSFAGEGPGTDPSVVDVPLELLVDNQHQVVEEQDQFDGCRWASRVPHQERDSLATDHLDAGDNNNRH